ncbi:hypothetical protein DUNSADRAFT_7561 [Dunaliella salina]|uniref:Uncharacterized protein n=1 Tax=Dunaliella salina TaxID=3046 RepID=A0ABQ7GL39_DUNSA|nr:hypothetical protein DUNSADRAFT_7561 [Dunaliella salina]|eukprot:KAF5835329.1 hypothetical protein DUNSADRAFT_7561 [Dunaliella salina]
MLAQQHLLAVQELCGLQRTLASMVMTQSPALIQPYSTADASQKTETPRLKIKRGSPLYHTHMARQKAFRRDMNQVLQQWRSEFALLKHQEGVKASGAAAAEQRRASQTGARHQVLNQFTEELRRAELDEELAQIRLRKAQRAEQRSAMLARQEDDRRAALLEASRHWISRETLVDSINHALDNPKPFGFTSNIPKLGSP